VGGATQLYQGSRGVHKPGQFKIKNTDKKEKEIFLIHKEIQLKAGAKSYMRKAPLDTVYKQG
jgi:hypothetical protein